jgi:hypothetical protein
LGSHFNGGFVGRLDGKEMEGNNETNPHFFPGLLGDTAFRLPMLV